MKTGDVIVRRKWTELPVPLDVIKQLNTLTINESESKRWDENTNENQEGVKDLDAYDEVLQDQENGINYEEDVIAENEMNPNSEVDENLREIKEGGLLEINMNDNLDEN